MIKIKKNIWDPTCDRFVVFMDIMGFRDMVYRNSHEEVMRMMYEFNRVIKSIDKTFGNKPSKKNPPMDDEDYKLVKPVIFSDSVLLFSSDGTPSSLYNTITALQCLTADALVKGIPIKGAIAYGKQTADLKESLFFGKPLIDAWELQNDLFLYGVVLHHTVERYIHQHKEDCKNIIDNCDIQKYDTPFKQGSISHYILDCTDYLQFIEEDIDIQSKIHEFYLTVSGGTRKYVDNTVEYLTYIMQKSIEEKKE
jgi:hypothetical protein